jgi:hypothetical protein
MASQLNQKAMLATLSISVWTARKYDKKVTETATKEYDSSIDAGRFNKTLLSGNKKNNPLKDGSVEKARASELADLINLATRARAAHYEMTLPWLWDGSAILSCKAYQQYMKKMNDFQEEFEKALDTFCKAYPILIEKDKKRLGKMFNADDYPSISAIKGKFSFNVDIMPLPVAGDFRADLQQEEIDTLSKKMQERQNKILGDAMKVAWMRLYDVVKNMADRLREEDPKFKASTINNVQEMCDILPMLNVTDDENLENMCKQVREKLTGLNTNLIRYDDEARKEVVDDADSILAAMAGYIGLDKEASNA